MISVFLMGAGMGVQGSAVSLRAGLEGFSNSLIGVIMSVNYVGLIIGSMIAPSLIRNVGYVRAFRCIRVSWFGLGDRSSSLDRPGGVGGISCRDGILAVGYVCCG